MARYSIRACFSQERMTYLSAKDTLDGIVTYSDAPWGEQAEVAFKKYVMDVDDEIDTQPSV